MIPNHSPWIKQLKRTRPVVPLKENLTTDIVIVGGGIAGVVTAYFILRDTHRKVVLLEADKIAHGATGHNAGQLVADFEKSFSEIVKEFSLKQATDGFKEIESSWTLLEDIFNEANLKTPLYRFTGYIACSTFEQLIGNLKDNLLRVQGGLSAKAIFVAEETDFIEKIPHDYKNLYETVSHKNLLSLLETDNNEYVAAVADPRGAMNSALFSEELIGYLIATYKGRFQFFEGSPVTEIVLKKDYGNVLVTTHTIEAQKIVLCTNGFENFKITNESGPHINTKFHHLINGRIGYMSGYLEPLHNQPLGIAYFTKEGGHSGDPVGEPYFYLTRRPHEHENKESYNLVCAGGPEKVLPNRAIYSREESCSEEIREIINEFLKNNYCHHPKNNLEYIFCWHGLMGYTPNGIRRIGPELCNPSLLYNLGCNGIGILPSVYGGKRISECLQGMPMEASIFDPHDQRCEIVK